MIHGVVRIQPRCWIQDEALLDEIYYFRGGPLFKEHGDRLTAFYDFLPICTLLGSYQLVLVEREKVIFLYVELLVFLGIFKHSVWDF